jgi:hypothetical protein
MIKSEGDQTDLKQQITSLTDELINLRHDLEEKNSIIHHEQTETAALRLRLRLMDSQNQTYQENIHELENQINHLKHRLQDYDNRDLNVIIEQASQHYSLPNVSSSPYPLHRGQSQSAFRNSGELSASMPQLSPLFSEDFGPASVPSFSSPARQQRNYGKFDMIVVIIFYVHSVYVHKVIYMIRVNNTMAF